MEKMKKKSRLVEKDEKVRLENELLELAQRRREGNVIAYQQAACMRHALLGLRSTFFDGFGMDDGFRKDISIIITLLSPPS